MDVAVFVPGTMGSKLKMPDGEIVWPPTAGEMLTGYGRADKLVREDLSVDGVIRSVMCFGVYEPLIQQLQDIGYGEAGAKRLVILAYDWRRDLEVLADTLAAKLAEQVAKGATSISIVAHSMGGLIARLAIEQAKFAGEEWLKRTKLLATLGTPHLGAPLALARIMGLDGAMGVSPADFAKLAADRRWPSGYQLLPPPGEAMAWDTRDKAMPVMNVYDPAIAQALKLDTQQLARAKWVHDTLSAGKPPAHVRYFFFAGTGHETVTRVNVGTTKKVLTKSQDAGDGTVPLWSALPRPGQKQTVVGEHAKFFTAENFKAVFYPLMGGTFARPPVTMAASSRLSVQAIVLAPADEVELLIIFSDPLGKVSGKIAVERTENEAKPFKSFRTAEKISYSGPPVPSLRVRLPALGKPGLYRIRFDGDAPAAEPAQFAVTGG